MDINTVISSAKERDIEGLLIAIDFEKAYDTVEWYALYIILQEFGFGVNFIKYVKICLENFYSAVINNGNRSKFFKLGRGLKQECPLSCQLFLLVVEVLGEKIRKDGNIEGIPIGIDGRKEKKLAQYADDLWIATKKKKKMFESNF